MSENVNHPKHYKVGNFECIDVMVDIFGLENTKTFCVMNAFKYIYRCEHKGKKSEDLQKAAWYLEKFRDLDGIEVKTDDQN